MHRAVRGKSSKFMHTGIVVASKNCFRHRVCPVAGQLTRNQLKQGRLQRFAQSLHLPIPSEVTCCPKPSLRNRRYPFALPSKGSETSWKPLYDLRRDRIWVLGRMYTVTWQGFLMWNCLEICCICCRRIQFPEICVANLDNSLFFVFTVIFMKWSQICLRCLKLFRDI